MLFYSFFKSLVGKDVVVELKNDMSICGTLHSVDQYLNGLNYKNFKYIFKTNLILIQTMFQIKLNEVKVTDPARFPHLLSIKNCFVRGSVVRYVQLPADEIDTQLLQDSARKEAVAAKQ